jgi:hypothetical protein
VAFIGLLAAYVWLTAGYVYRLKVIDTATQPTGLDLVRARASDDWLDGAIHVVNWTRLAVTITFPAWMFVAARASQRIRPDGLRHSPRWAIVAWLIPFVSLRRPPKIVNDIWAAPRPIGDLRTSTPLVAWWWALFLAANATSRPPWRRSHHLAGLSRDARWHLMASPLTIAAIGCAVTVVVTVTRRLTNYTGLYDATAEVDLDSERQVAPPDQGSADIELAGDEKWESWLQNP